MSFPLFRKLASAAAMLAFGVAVALVTSAGAFASATVSATSLTTGTPATASAYDPAGTVVAVANYGINYIGILPADIIASTVDLIDTATNTVRTVADPAITKAQSLVWSPDGTKVYVLNNDGVIAVVDAASATVMGTVPTGPGTFVGIAITPDGQKLLVGDGNSNDIQIITLDPLASVSVTTSVHTDPSQSMVLDVMSAIFVSPDGTKAFAVGATGVVDEIDLTINSYPIIHTYLFDGVDRGSNGYNESVCSNFDVSTLYMAEYNNDGPAVLARMNLADGATASVTATVPESKGCNMTPDGKSVLFGAYAQGDNPDPSKVFEVNATTLAAVTAYDRRASRQIARVTDSVPQ